MNFFAPGRSLQLLHDLKKTRTVFKARGNVMQLKRRILEYNHTDCKQLTRVVFADISRAAP
jgi:hypothetical protein